MNRSILQAVAVLLIASPSLSSETTPAVDAVELIPIARYVSEESKLRSYPAFKASVAAGTAQYDSTFRHPFLPLGRLVLDCRSVKRVGVTLALKFSDFHGGGVGHRYPTSLSKDTTVKYIWTHSEHSEEGGRYFSKFRVHPHRRVELISYGLTLRDIDRTDGELRVEIVVNSELLYQTSFELVGCDNAT